MLHRLRQAGFNAVVFEAGSGVGGTWYWNRYPGARCDVESMEYSYSFSDDLQQDWEWTERYAGQPEILRYANHVADRFDLRRDIVFDTRVVKAHFDEADASWDIETDTGLTVAAWFCVLATGCLSSANPARLRGRDELPRRDLSHGALAPRRRRFRGQTRGHHRHRLVRHPGHPGDRRRSTPPDRLPAHAELLHPGPQRADRSGPRRRHQSRVPGVSGAELQGTGRLRFEDPEERPVGSQRRRAEPGTQLLAPLGTWRVRILERLQRPDREPRRQRDRG